MGERDLGRMLATLSVRRRPGVFSFVSVDAGDARFTELAAVAQASIVEDEGTTFVVEEATATGAGFAVDFRAAWLTLEVFSALDAVGLTAAVSAALTDVGVSCNVLAGTHHDHLLVPVDDAGRALDALDALARRAPGLS
jgi:hypothetical protein